MSDSLIKLIYYLTALYDAALGVGFVLFYGRIFSWFEVTPPNHPGYVQFPGLLLIVFAIMYYAIARAPRSNRGLIPYGIGLKLAYAGIVFFHWTTGGIPGMWKPFAVIDIVFALLFYWTYRALATNRPGARTA
ncbi:MAG TPA: hypothetical protein VLB27_07700 [candidate division Zixibacteria bacterium]|nr:hypothetical protein [candidate division Zixibacteria bacterium]